MNKKNFVLFLILLLLGGGLYFYQKIILPRREQAAKIANFLAPLQQAAIDKIIITKNKQETVLLKNNNAWQVASANNWPVEPLLMENFWREFNAAQSSAPDLISTSAAAKKDLKLEETGIKLKLLQGETVLLEALLDYAPTGGTLLAPLNSDSVYGFSGELTGAVANSEWRDLNIFKSSGAALTHLTIERGSQIIKLEKVDNNWRLVGEPQLKINQEQAAALAAMLADLNASSLSESAEAADDLAKSNFKIIASGADFKNVLIIGQEKKVNGRASGEFYVKAAESAAIYLISKEQYDILAADLKGLK